MYEESPSDGPEELKRRGNEAFSREDYSDALELWKSSLKKILKAGVAVSRGDENAKMYSNKDQLTLRLNMAQGHIKLGQWTDAAMQARLYLEHYPNNTKALYRYGIALKCMQDWRKARSTFQMLLDFEPGNSAAIQALRELNSEERVAQVQTGRMYRKMMLGGALHDDRSVTASVDAEPHQQFIFWQDEDESPEWLVPHSSDEIKELKSPPLLLLSYPLSLLHAIASLPETATALGGKKKATVHVLGATGPNELESNWSSILQRVPLLEELSVVLVGFLNSDHWAKNLGERNLTPPLVKQFGEDRRVVCRLFKGYYHEFCEMWREDLDDPGKSLAADLYYIPNPSFSEDLDHWIPSLDIALASRKICVVTDYARKQDIDNNCTTTSRPVLEGLDAEFILHPELNRFSLLVTDADGDSYSGKNAVVMVVRGTETAAAKTSHKMNTKPPRQE